MILLSDGAGAPHAGAERGASLVLRKVLKNGFNYGKRHRATRLAPLPRCARCEPEVVPVKSDSRTELGLDPRHHSQIATPGADPTLTAQKTSVKYHTPLQNTPEVSNKGIFCGWS
jgi:hypothetical protein